jgi:uncharacterized protein (UPF0276 family)
MLPALGYALRQENRPVVEEPAWTGVEIEFGRASHPLRVVPYLHGLSFEYVSVHDLHISVASPEPPPRSYIDDLVAVADENGAAAITDHLGFNYGESGGANAGHVTAPPWTPAALDATCRNVDFIQRRFGHVKFYLENLTHFFVLPGTMSEADFFGRLLEKTGCGLLLDVTNAYANAVNFGHYDAREFIQEVVSRACRVQVHLGGGKMDPKAQRYLDSHSEPISDAIWDLYRYALGVGRGKVDAVFIEREHNAPDELGWRREVRQLRQVTLEMEGQP